jgi:hypothetical protein
MADVLREKSHALLSAVAKMQQCKVGTLVGKVSAHELPRTVSFQVLERLHQCCKEASALCPQSAYVGTDGARMVFSVRFDDGGGGEGEGEGDGDGEADGDAPPRGVKRQRVVDNCDDRVEAVLAGLRKAKVADAKAKQAGDVLRKLLARLRGQQRETAVDSFCVTTKKLAPEDAAPRVVLAVRLNAGIAVPLGALQRCLGACWKDGVLSIEDDVGGVSVADLPRSGLSKAAGEFGIASMHFVTSV